MATCAVPAFIAASIFPARRALQRADLRGSVAQRARRQRVAGLSTFCRPDLRRGAPRTWWARTRRDVWTRRCTEYDLVVLDSPPLLGFPEPLQMAAAVDGVIMVAVAGRTNRKALGSAINTLKRLRANIVGVVLNEVRADSSDNYYYYHYHPKYYKHYNTVVGSEG